MNSSKPTINYKPYYDKHGWSKKKRFGIVMLILLIELAIFLFVI